jgi:hypothetical protein
MVGFRCTYHDLLPKAQKHTEFAIEAERLAKRFFQARDIWMKQKIY